MTTYSIVDLVKFLLNNGVKYVFTEHFCTDPVENYFGRQRSMGRWSDNPTISSFGYNQSRKKK